VKRAAEWVKENLSATGNPPVISEGNTVLQFEDKTPSRRGPSCHTREGPPARQRQLGAPAFVESWERTAAFTHSDSATVDVSPLWPLGQLFYADLDSRLS
jgi:hypothetical protein